MWLSNIPGEGQGELAEPSTFRPCSSQESRMCPRQQLPQQDEPCAVPSSAAFLDGLRQLQDSF